MSEVRAAGPLSGLRVIELASGSAAYAGKLLADFGAEVLLVEPPGGHPTRRLAPFARELGEGHPDRSLWFWHYNTSKLGIELDLDSPEGADSFRGLVAHADIVLEAEPVGRLSALGLDYTDLSGPGRSGPGRSGPGHSGPGPAGPGPRGPDVGELDASTVWVSVTPFGRDDPRSLDPFTDLTVVAGGGIAWNCGYDDHTLAPMSSLGHQGYQTASIWAAVGALVAVRARTVIGRGQLVDVSMHAAANVTTEQATHFWLVAQRVVRRQTGRHAAYVPTESTIQRAADGHEVHTGFPPRHADEVARLVAWLDDLGLREQFPMTVLLELAVEQGGIDLAKLQDDEFTQECYRAARDAIALIAGQLSHRDFFLEGQARGFAVGMILAPDEVMADEHMAARRYPVAVHQPQLSRAVLHAGLPIRFVGTPGAIRSAPAPGEHQHLLDRAQT